MAAEHIKRLNTFATMYVKYAFICIYSNVVLNIKYTIAGMAS